jgi:hypothetical protein
MAIPLKQSDRLNNISPARTLSPFPILQPAPIRRDTPSRASPCQAQTVEPGPLGTLEILFTERTMVLAITVSPSSDPNPRVGR